MVEKLKAVERSRPGTAAELQAVQEGIRVLENLVSMGEEKNREYTFANGQLKYGNGFTEVFGSIKASAASSIKALPALFRSPALVYRLFQYRFGRYDLQAVSSVCSLFLT